MGAAVAGVAATGGAVEPFLWGDGKFAASLAPAREEGWGEEVGDGSRGDFLGGGTAAGGHVLGVAHGELKGALDTGVADTVLAGEEGGLPGRVVGEADDAGDGFGFGLGFEFGIGFRFRLSRCGLRFGFGRPG